ncbi:MAG: hypothetical protein VYE64_02695 [Planctomycetota bacterium]|nr:hypothetical protein [Planctomycetota bacterium]
MKKRHSTPFDDGRGHEFISILNWLKSLDVPILLDESARDDSLTESDIVVLKLPGTPLLDRLQQSLKVNNATLAMFPDHVAIVSMDVAQDPDYFLSEFYPIEYISSGNYQELLEDIKASINPLGWNETNGDAHISYLSVNGQPSLSLYAPYTTHQRLQEYLSNIRRISPVGVGRQLVTSQVIQLPSARAKQRPKKKKGYGIGGFGGGGGMF